MISVWLRLRRFLISHWSSLSTRLLKVLQGQIGYCTKEIWRYKYYRLYSLLHGILNVFYNAQRVIENIYSWYWSVNESFFNCVIIIYRPLEIYLCLTENSRNYSSYWQQYELKNRSIYFYLHHLDNFAGKHIMRNILLRSL